MKCNFKTKRFVFNQYGPTDVEYYKCQLKLFDGGNEECDGEEKCILHQSSQPSIQPDQTIKDEVWLPL